MCFFFFFFLTCRFIFQLFSEIISQPLPSYRNFTKSLDGSVGKESTCNAGDSGLIPGLGGSTGKGISCPLQYCWASLVIQLVKNPPAMQET